MSSMKNVFKRAAFGAALAACVAVPVLKPSPAEAWWRGGGWGWHAGWGWHGGWGWRPWGGVYVGVPPVAVVGAPVPYAPPYRFIPGHYTPGGYWIAPHWGYY